MIVCTRMSTSTFLSRILLSFSRLRRCHHPVRLRNHCMKGTFLIGGVFGVPSFKKSRQLDQKKTDELPKLEVPDASKLSKESLIRSASINTTEEVGTLALQTALALIQAEKEYSEAVFALVVLMEYKLTVLDDATEEERIWDLVLQGRDLVNRTKEKKRTLEMIFVNAKNMLNTAADVAFMTGAEFAGSLASDRMYKMEQHLKQIQDETEDAEIKLRQIEVKTIEVETEHAEKTSESAENVSQLDNDTKSDANTKGDSDTNVDEPTSTNANNSQGLTTECKAINNNAMSSANKESNAGDSGLSDVGNLKDLSKVLEEQVDEVGEIKDMSKAASAKDDAHTDDITDRSVPSNTDHEDLKF